MAEAARILEKELHRRKDAREVMQSRADVDEINRRIEAHEAGNTEMYSRDEAKAMLESMGYNG